ncbi:MULTISPECIES: S9 family peptidase [Sphingobacterium]|uniref:Prolyl oligopeptidase family serine peptidase n=1 Tax=Sphingobacterium populi TaxID=1812824 RepID=A0ABW5UF81_9SPHI|nr:S9 family peptidase [Sphingobacterium sp. CFCC 11742]
MTSTTLSNTFLAFIGFIIWQPAIAQQSDIRISDLKKIKQITDVQVPMNGSEVSYAVKDIVADSSVIGGFTYRTQWFTQALKPQATTNKQSIATHDKLIEQIAYAPDGKRWAIAKRVGKDKQLYAYNTNFLDTLSFSKIIPYQVQQVRFSADGKKALLAVRLTLQDLITSKNFNPTDAIPAWSFEKPGDAANKTIRKSTAQADADGDAQQVAAYLQQNEEKSIAKLTNKLQFQTESSTTGTLYFTHWYTVDLTDTTSARPLTTGFRSYPRAEFIAADQVIASVDRDTLAHPDRINSSDIVLININSGTQERVLGDGVHRYQLEAVATSGKKVAISQVAQNSLTLGQLWVYDTKSWQGKGIVHDRNQAQVQFGQKDDELYFLSSSNGGKVINQVDLSSGKVLVLTSVDEGINDYWVGKKQAVFSKTTYANPSELFISTSDFSKSEAITQINADWLAGKSIAKPEKFTFTNELGLEVEYWLLKPAAASTSHKSPLLVQIHGGPASMFGPGDASMWHEYQYFIAKGYGVLYGNPRGSNGYGEAFLQSNYRDWGLGPSKDVLTAVDKVVSQGWVNSNNLYVTGGSYGAFLTTWIIAHDHRFRAASSQRGVYDLYTFFGSGNVWPMLKRYFGGFPWENGIKQILEEQSPITYATDIQTPLLIFHGENDNRTGPTQSDYLYKQLKYLDREVEYVRHPDADHEITRSGNVAQRIDQMLRTYEFFERFRDSDR